MAFLRWAAPTTTSCLRPTPTARPRRTARSLNGVTIHFVNDAPAAGQEHAEFDPGTPATNGTAAPRARSPCTSRWASDPAADRQRDQRRRRPAVPSRSSTRPTRPRPLPSPSTQLPADALTAGGSGTAFDQNSGLQITNDGKTFTVSLSGDKPSGTCSIPSSNRARACWPRSTRARRASSICSRLSGPSFSIGENGGKTATQLGVRTLTAATELADLNSGSGVGLLPAGAGGPDFTITQPDQNIQPQRQPGGIDHGRPGLRLHQPARPRPPARILPPN